jgi:hypothetical protein
MSQERPAGSRHMDQLLSLRDEDSKAPNISHFLEFCYASNIKIISAEENETTAFLRFRRQIENSMKMWTIGHTFVFKIEMPVGETDFYLESCPGKDRLHNAGIQIYREGHPNDLSKNWLRAIMISKNGDCDFIFGSNSVKPEGENSFIIHRGSDR